MRSGGARRWLGWVAGQSLGGQGVRRSAALPMVLLAITALVDKSMRYPRLGIRQGSISRTGSETRRGTSSDSCTAVTSSPSRRVRSKERT